MHANGGASMHSKFLPQGSEVGAVGVHYRVWAPVCRTLDLEIFDSADALLRRRAMTRAGDGCFHLLDETGQPGDLYKFRLNGEQSLPDPASRWQPHGVHGPSMVIDPRAFQWSDAAWGRPRF